MSPRTLGILVLAVLVLSCTREESTSEQRSPIQSKNLPTPKTGQRVADARKLAAPTPITSAGDAPDIIEEVRGGKGEARAVATVAVTPTVAATATVAAAMTPLPAATAPVQMAAARPGFVPRGTDLFAAPSGASLGRFEGRTAVDVLEEAAGWSRVRAPVIGGGDVEGWVKSAAVTGPNESRPAGKAPAVKPDKAPASTVAAKPAASPPKKVAAAKAPGDKGPNDIMLVPIAGTAKKRPATPFTHKAHYEDYSIPCASCHHPVKAKGGTVPSYSCAASGCHTANECNGATVGKKDKACPNFEDAYHIQCIDCHKKDGGPTKCAECHTG